MVLNFKCLQMLTYVLTTARFYVACHSWIAGVSNYTFSITYKPGRNHQDVNVLSRIQWPEVMKMKSHTVKVVCEGIQIYYGKVEVVSHSVHTLTNLFRDNVQSGITPDDWSQA